MSVRRGHRVATVMVPKIALNIPCPEMGKCYLSSIPICFLSSIPVFFISCLFSFLSFLFCLFSMARIFSNIFLDNFFSLY